MSSHSKKKGKKVQSRKEQSRKHQSRTGKADARTCQTTETNGRSVTRVSKPRAPSIKPMKTYHRM